MDGWNMKGKRWVPQTNNPNNRYFYNPAYVWEKEEERGETKWWEWPRKEGWYLQSAASAERGGGGHALFTSPPLPLTCGPRGMARSRYHSLTRRRTLPAPLSTLAPQSNVIMMTPVQTTSLSPPPSVSAALSLWIEAWNAPLTPGHPSSVSLFNGL